LIKCGRRLSDTSIASCAHHDGEEPVVAEVKELVKRASKGALEAAGIGAIVGFRGTRDVALTFDDGPDAEDTPRVLDVLAKHGARATFFVLGARAERYPVLMARIRDEGHAVGHHTWDHPSCVLSDTSDIRLFRPPFGHWDLTTAWIARREGLQLVSWNAETDDQLPAGAKHFRDRLCAVVGGSIVLMHDRLGLARDVRGFDRSDLIVALDEALARAPEDRRFRTLPDLLARAQPVLETRLWPYSVADRQGIADALGTLLANPAA
jgi:peptidoglycan-N-acetylglucosamine deacetylase